MTVEWCAFLTRSVFLCVGALLQLGCVETTTTETPLLVAVVEVIPSSLSMPVGFQGQLSATPMTATRQSLTARPVQWSSLNPSVATVNGAGVVTGNAVGSATITASSGGVIGTAAVSVASPGAISVFFPTSAITLQQGSSGTATFRISRMNYTGLVSWVFSGMPAGVTVSVDSVGTTSDTTSARAVVSVSAASPPGTYPITVTVSGLGVTNATAQLLLAVQQSGSGNVIFRFCAPFQPLWVGYQTLGGQWATATALNGAYSFNINTRGAVAWVQSWDIGDGTTKTSLEVYYGTTSELNTRGNYCAHIGPKTVNVTATGLGGAEEAIVSLGDANATLRSGATSAQLRNVRDGTADLVVARQQLVDTVGTISHAVALQLDLNPADGSTLIANVSTANSVFRTATIANVDPVETTFFSSIIRTKNGTRAALFWGVGHIGRTTKRWTGAPDVLMTADNWHEQNVGASSEFGSRNVRVFNRLAADRTYTLPPKIAVSPALSVQGTSPYLRINHTWAIQSADYGKFWVLQYVPASGSVLFVRIYGTSGYFGSGPVRLDLPQFNAGFNPLYGLQPGIALDWAFTAEGGSAGSAGAGVFEPIPAEGAVSFLAVLRGRITP